MVEAHDPYFVQKQDVIEVIGLFSLQKMTTTMRMLIYGVAADFMDDYVRIGENTVIESLERFVKAVVVIFSDVYLRMPHNNDIAKLLAVGKNHGFLEMLGSSDFFGLPGSHNDINVLEHSFVFSVFAEGHAPPINYSINGHDYKMGYYLADGIYPQWPTFVKTISCPQGNKQLHFAKAQESARKDVERAFGVLQAHFAIVQGHAHFWKCETLKDIMKACIILHNMIIENKQNVNNIDFNYDAIDGSPPLSVSHKCTSELYEFIQNHHYIRDRQTHSKLQEDLIEHLWHQYGDS
ncbi:uncharacterized protein LOC114309152 [Camellia sinensis]|uniref:uncharacterized protein LOC114309152 n=1 Tax=Camellia sinensis TaxID=4442 RepID=UPI00103699DD|nr:uncharacterized protein LOC114309152 [Camellia sinensis]